MSEKNNKNEGGNTTPTVFVIKILICKQKATLTVM